MANINCSGVVTALSAKKIQITAEEGRPCPGCNGRCGFILWRRLFPRKKPIWIDTTAQWKVGDAVNLSVDAQTFLLLCSFTYLLPLLMMMMGLVFANAWGFSEGVMLLSGLLGLGVGFGFSSRLKLKALKLERKGEHD